MWWISPLGTFPSKAAFSYCWQSHAHSSHLLAIQKSSSIFLMVELLNWFYKTNYFLFSYLRAYLWETQKELTHNEDKHSFQVNSLNRYLHNLKTTCFLTSMVLFYHILPSGTNKLGAVLHWYFSHIFNWFSSLACLFLRVFSSKDTEKKEDFGLIETFFCSERNKQKS